MYVVGASPLLERRANNVLTDSDNLNISKTIINFIEHIEMMGRHESICFAITVNPSKTHANGRIRCWCSDHGPSCFRF
jgi:hypothetical protein